MAFIPMTKKVRPWKRGLRGLSGLGDTNSDLIAQANVKRNQARVERQAAADTAWWNWGERAARNALADRYEAEAVAISTQAKTYRAGVASTRPITNPGSIPSPSSVPKTSIGRGTNDDTAHQLAAQRGEAARRAAAKGAAVSAGDGRTPEDLEAEARSLREKAATAPVGVREGLQAQAQGLESAAAALRARGGSSGSGGGGTSFADVLNGIADVIGVAAPVADRIVQNEQQRKAADLARRAERAAANGIITSGQPPTVTYGFQPSVYMYGVGGLVVVGVSLWALSSLLGGSSTPTVVVAK